MQDQLKQCYLEYEEYNGGQSLDMSGNISGDLLTEEGYLDLIRDLRLKRKELDLNNQEYIILLDYLDCCKCSEIENVDRHLAELNEISQKTVQRRLGALEKKGLLRREIRVIDGRIKGFTYSPEPLVRKLRPECDSGSGYMLQELPQAEINSARESGEDYEQEKIKEKKWKDEFCSTRWYNDVFSEMYEEASGQPVLTGGREYKSAETYFRRLGQLNPELVTEDIYMRATEGARYIIDSQLRGGVFGWLHKPPDICMLANQTQAVDYQLRCIERVYGQPPTLKNWEDDGCKVEILFTKKDKEKENASEQIERVYSELKEIEQGDV